MSKPVCLVTAPVGTRSGYGAHARDIVRALIKLDKYDNRCQRQAFSVHAKRACMVCAQICFGRSVCAHMNVRLFSQDCVRRRQGPIDG